MRFNSPEQVKNLLLHTIADIESERDIYTPPGSFSRTKKISFENTMLFPMLCAQNNLATEILDFFDEKSLPSVSAMHQRRKQISSEAYRVLFESFSHRLPQNKTYKGLRIIACDGTRLDLPYNPSDQDTFMQSIPGRKGINQMHLTMLHDILNDVFLDVCMDYGSNMNEYSAFNTMIDRFSDDSHKTLFIADRGFCSINCMAHAIHNGQLFLIRKTERTDLLRFIDENILTKNSFDVTMELFVGKRRKYGAPYPDNFIWINNRRKYDYVESGSYDLDRLKIRLLKIPLDNGTSEFIVTNLPSGTYSSLDIKELYNLRWGIETSFRTLKYAGKLIYVHSLNRDLVLQEIYGKLTLYNFASVVRSISDRTCLKDVRHKTKYMYSVNRSQVVKICIRFIKGLIKDILGIIGGNTLPVKPGRKFARNLRRQAAESLQYR